MASKYSSGQAVQVLLQRDDADLWMNAKIIDVKDDYIRVKYLRIIPGNNMSLDFILKSQIESKLRPAQNDDEENNSNMTLDFKKGDFVKFKLASKEDIWVPAKVSYVGNTLIQVIYNLNGNQHEAGVTDVEYEDRIRVISSTNDECQDNKDSDIKMEEKPETNSNNGSNGNNGNWFTNHVTNAVIYFTGDGSDKNIDTKPQKRVKLWNEKAISEWSHKDVVSWVKSMKSYEKYAHNFSNHMDGKELLDTSIDDLTLIIPKKLWRRKFMQQIELAKKKYAKCQSNDDDDDDDYKESSKIASNVNGVVGLQNLVNTCYMNTSIQILSQSPYITRYLKKRAKMNHKTGNGQYPMLTAWTHLCNIIYNQNKKSGWRDYTVVSPKKIRDALKEIDSEFGAGTQDDSSRSLGYMLQALDQEIDEKIKNQKTKKKTNNIIYKEDIPIYHGHRLNQMEKNDYIKELLRDCNPCNSIVRKTFDGIEHVSCECLECNHMFQQFTTFRIIDLAVVSHEIKLNNINIICNDENYCIEEISVLDYCSVDLLQYFAVQYLITKNNEKIIDYDANVVIISPNGKIQNINNYKLSQLQNLNGGIFVLINKNKTSKNETGRILQIDLISNRNGDKSKILSVRYNKYDPNMIHKLARSQIMMRMNDNDDEKYNCYVNYNGNVLTSKELKKDNFSQNMHNIEGTNVLLLLKVNQNTTKYCYDMNDVDLKILWEATDIYKNSSKLDAMTQFESMKKKRKNEWSQRKGYDSIKDRVELELNAINKTMQVLQAKQNILNVTNNFIKLSNNKYKFSISTCRQLIDLIECLKEYQKPKILDQTRYAFPCPNCKSGSNSQWVKVEKQIVYSPPIFLFHLDRYGKNMTSNNVNSVKSSSYQKGQVLMVNYRSKSYKARVLNVNSNGMQIQYISDKQTEWIPQSNYFMKLPSHSSRNGYINHHGSNKFDHSINYDIKLKWNASSGDVYEYDLYGVSNHSGTTNGGHYTATIKCLTDKKWYDISDSNVTSNYIQPLSNSTSATILAYVRKQDS